jgi:hypothetical protein
VFVNQPIKQRLGYNSKMMIAMCQLLLDVMAQQIETKEVRGKASGQRFKYDNEKDQEVRERIKASIKYYQSKI